MGPLPRRVPSPRPLVLSLALLAALSGSLPAQAPAAGQAAPSAAAGGSLVPGQRWIDHLERDLAPFWTTGTALGEPVGNFPTVRNYDGSLAPGEDYRLPRMLGRQIYFYSVAYLLTGRERYLGYAKAGLDWLVSRGWDQAYGGWHARLDRSGKPLQGDKYAQDMAYAAQGLAAYFMVTRDPLAEEYLKKTRDLIFDPATFWDAGKARLRDGMDYRLKREVDMDGGGWDLVAPLDQINAYLLLAQPFLSKAEDREQWAKDLVALGTSVKRDFWMDGIFWGQRDWIGRGGNHVDFGHTLKSYWMLYLIDQNVGSKLTAGFPRPWTDYVDAILDQGFDPKQGMWGKGWQADGSTVFGPSWWIYAECDQMAMTRDMMAPGSRASQLAATQASWLGKFVDHPYGEVYSDLLKDGTPATPGEIFPTAKQNEWKNGFHSAEHALVSYLHERSLAGLPAELYFAAEAPASFKTKPYVFPGRELSREARGSFSLGGRTYVKLLSRLVVELK